jgi:hypothetical protein
MRASAKSVCHIWLTVIATVLAGSMPAQAQIDPVPTPISIPYDVTGARMLAAQYRAAAAQIRQQAADVNTTAANVESNTATMGSAAISAEARASDLEGQLANVRTAISQRRLDLQRVQDEINRIPAEISRLRSETLDLRLEAARFRGEAMQSQVEFAQTEQQKIDVKTQIASLLQQNFILVNQIEVKRLQNNRLAALEDQVRNEVASTDAIARDVANIQAQFETLGTAHESWSNRFISQVNQKVPQWQQVVDLQSYDREYQKILSFVAEMPSDAEVAAIQGQLTKAIADESTVIAQLQTRLRRFADGENLAVYRKEKPDSTVVSDIEALDDALANLYQSLSRMEKLALRLDSVRRYLKTIVASHWLQILKIRLHSANVERAGQTIDEATRILRSPIIYGEIKGTYAQRRNKASDDLYFNLAPRHAYRESVVGLQWLSEIKNNLAMLQLSESFTRQLTVEIQGMHYELNDLAGQALLSIAQEGADYLAERQRLVNERLTSTPQLSQYCQEIASIVLAQPDGSESEDNYLAFTQSCN